ncbi:hypothetical protein HPB47_003276, partial [Ixodes persulcatus]
MPKSEMLKFDGRTSQWQAFWDVFQNAIDQPPQLEELSSQVAEKYHGSGRKVSLVNINSSMSATLYTARVVDGLVTNTPFNVVCLLSRKTYFGILLPVRFVLLGPGRSRRGTCRGQLVLATGKPGFVPHLTREPVGEKKSSTMILVGVVAALKPRPV